MDANSNLCTACQRILSSTTWTDPEHQTSKHHVNLDAMFQAAESGCHLCKILVHYGPDIKSEEHLKIHPREHMMLKWDFKKRSSDPDEIPLHFTINTRKPAHTDQSGHYIGSYAQFNVRRGVHNLPGPSTIGNSTRSKESWDLAFRWIDQCRKSHTRCQEDTKSKFKPSRLVHVGTFAKPELNLSLLPSHEAAGPYLTLSHCWGHIPIKGLTQENLSQLCDSIDINELPASFQDAIQFTRSFGASYIWIDSLCIIQDSIGDWECESSLMGEIYKNGLCNLAATAASDGSQGCFYERDPCLVAACRVEFQSLPSPLKNSENLVLRDFPQLVTLFPDNLILDEVDDGPLNQRAWVVQERMLSPRVLHFAQSQIFWECKELVACETYPLGIPSIKWPLQRSYPHHPNSHWHQQPSSAALTLSTHQALSQWTTVLRDYTKCSLTKDSDRLVAISAIAKELQPSIDGTYFAGIWSQHLLLQLLWFYDSSDTSGRRPDAYCAPTWSWASVISPKPITHAVNFHDFDHDIASQFQSLSAGKEYLMAELRDVHVSPVTSDPMGQITYGSLNLSGWLLDLKKFELDHFLTFDMANMASIYADVEILCNTDGLLFLPVVAMRHDDSENWRYRLGPVIGLVLVRAGVGDPNAGDLHVYRRVGLLKSRAEVGHLFKPPCFQSELAIDPKDDEVGVEAKRDDYYEDVGDWIETDLSII